MDLREGNARRFYAAPAALHHAGGDCLLPGVQRCTETGFEASVASALGFLRRAWCGECRVCRGSRRRPQSQAVEVRCNLERIEARQVAHLIIAHKDRLARFGFPWFERFCANTGPNCWFLIRNNSRQSRTWLFCPPLGLRDYCKKLNDALAADIR
jgi:hypothetical protein